ncbi:cyclic nucleotide-binding/CBS domain-containing protein [Nonomuraea pusilla]|uniref:CBS domain-containing protein n=1 Tax=Nonomuraea pusilla TaxID=46177 RepID=A0A1H8BVQ3_9ACTN|nr:CBS domain-containing protein [Nonomuraea pusilla]SEM86866.1 CBS domain-containing protein [Nonomuraea pusilla]
MQIANVYRPMVFGCQAGDALPEVARRMTEKNVGALAVLEGDRVAGVITERDVVTALATSEDPLSLTAGTCASTDMKVAGLDEDTREVARRMLDHGIRHMPVDEAGRLVGMVSMRDLLAVETWTE